MCGGAHINSYSVILIKKYKKKEVEFEFLNDVHVSCKWLVTYQAHKTTKS